MQFKPEFSPQLMDQVLTYPNPHAPHSQAPQQYHNHYQSPRDLRTPINSRSQTPVPHYYNNAGNYGIPQNPVYQTQLSSSFTGGNRPQSRLSQESTLPSTYTTGRFPGIPENFELNGPDLRPQSSMSNKSGITNLSSTSGRRRPLQLGVLDEQGLVHKITQEQRNMYKREDLMKLVDGEWVPLYKD